MTRRERSYIAIIAALALHAVALAILHFTPFSTYQAPSPYAEVDLMEESDEALEEETHTLEDLMRQRVAEDVANLVADANAERSEQRQSSLSQRANERLDAQVEGELRQFEQEAFEAMAERRKAKESERDGEEGEAEKAAQSSKQQALEKYDYYGKAYNGNVTAEYDLPGREARLIHIPGYKCKGGGLVKVNITVNPSGEVMEAEIDGSASSYTGDCLPTEALSSARKSVFFIKSSAAKKQRGSITYRFIPQ